MNENRIIVIGGSAGSFPIILEIIEKIPKEFPIPIVLCIHRLKNVRTGFLETISLISKNKVVEPFDGDKIEPATIYIAPANYHLLVQKNNTFSLSVEETVNYSRPSIDVFFSSAAKIYKEKAIGIILSGANNDGAEGLQIIQSNNGTTIVQDPKEAQVIDMPQSAINQKKPNYIINSELISAYIQNLV